ncbi:MAG: hypothetical protein ACOY3M_02955 [Patescibacteria group bacterium]
MAGTGILNQIGESFETIAQDVARETTQAPKDMVGAALESVGITTGKKGTKQQQAVQQGQPEGAAPVPVTGEVSDEVKRAIARAALEELSGKRPKQKELSVWEKLQQEEEQKKEMEKKRKEQAAKQAIPKTTAKRARGDLYGVKAKKSAAENRNLRQD